MRWGSTSSRHALDALELQSAPPPCCGCPSGAFGAFKKPRSQPAF